MIALRDGRQAGDDLTPVIAAVVTAPHLAGGRRGEERERVPPVLEAHRLERRPETIG